jgi:NADPH-dependent glutamate synthase beta subunit-like oxidoreductase
MKRWSGVKHLEDLPPVTISQIPILENKTGSWRTMCPQVQRKIPPCNEACPAGEDVEKMMVLVGEGKFYEAWQLIVKENPLPGSCGRVCFHPCEIACNRKNFDGNVHINVIERAIFDYVARENLIISSVPAEKKKERVAVVGSGPAGLSCTYHLGLMGYQVTLIEALPVLGGMLRAGIPEYRLPKKVLNKEIESILSLGIRVRTNTRLGEDIGLEDLMKFDAVFLSPGAWKKADSGVTLEAHDSIVNGLDLLRRLNLSEKIELGRRVIVIGGGNTAIDVARSLLRRGSLPTILYRRSRDEMPAFGEEVAAAEKEGVKILYLASPRRALFEDGKLVGLECIENRLAENDLSGRRRIISVDGSHFTVKTDMIVVATGEVPDISFGGDRLKTRDQTIEVNGLGATNLPGFFAGGDSVGGVRSVAHAIGWGKRGAVSIDLYIRNKNPENIFESIRVGSNEAYSVDTYRQAGDHRNHTVVHFGDLNIDYFEWRESSLPRSLSIREAPASFEEVSKGISEAEAVEEARRCFNCGVCNQCGNCYLFCPDFSVSLTEGIEEPTINFDYCKGCGICIKECPRGVISAGEEIR